LLNPIGRTTSLSYPSFNNPSSNPSLFSKYVLNSKPYETYLKSAASGIASFLLSAQDVQASAQQLMQKDQSAFLSRTAESSDSKKVSAAVSAGAANRTYDVKVYAIAASQKNSGALLSKSDPSVVSAGTNQFNIQSAVRRRRFRRLSRMTIRMIKRWSS